MCKFAGEARFANARLTTDEDNPSLPITCQVKSSLHAGDFLFAPYQLGLQYSIGIELAGNILLWKGHEGGRDRSGPYSDACFGLMTACVRVCRCILQARS